MQIDIYHKSSTFTPLYPQIEPKTFLYHQTMFPSQLLLFLLLPWCMYCYDCYNQKCRGAGGFSDTYIDCDQEKNRCDSLPWEDGYPVCRPGSPGAGVYCRDGTDYCYADEDGVAYCDSSSDTEYWVIIGPCIGGGVLLIIGMICCCTRLNRPVTHTFIIQPGSGGQYHDNQPWVVHAGTAQPVLLQKPGEPNYGATSATKFGVTTHGDYPGASSDEPPPYEQPLPSAPADNEYNDIYPSI